MVIIYFLQLISNNVEMQHLFQRNVRDNCRLVNGLLRP